jgi:DNA-binding transcriptional regulator WhiA
MVKIIIPKMISEDLAYLCGVFAGDGSINFREKKNEYSLKCVGNPKDEKEFYLEVIDQKFKNVFGLSLNMKLHDSETTYGFSIYSKDLYYFLTEKIDLPSGLKYDKLAIPEIFLKEKRLTLAFVRGVFDTDGCISFKKRYRDYPYYPVISLSSKSSKFIIEISNVLKNLGFKPVLTLNYKLEDFRVKNEFTIISRLELNGKKNLELWLDKMGFLSPKHLSKIKRYSGG